MRSHLIIFLLGILVSCSSNSDFDMNKNSDSEFEPYKKDFNYIVQNTNLKNKVDNIKIIFGNLNVVSNPEKSTLGTCYGMGAFRSFIVIDEEYWKTASPTSKAFTVYHELGHCVCSLQHTESSDSWYKPFEEIMFKIGLIKRKAPLDDGCPGSIMHPSSFSEYCMLNNFMYYLEDLKKDCK